MSISRFLSRIDWYYDGEMYHTVTPDDLGGKEWVFDQPFFIILNLAVGGTLGDSRFRHRLPGAVLRGLCPGI